MEGYRIILLRRCRCPNTSHAHAGRRNPKHSCTANLHKQPSQKGKTKRSLEDPCEEAVAPPVSLAIGRRRDETLEKPMDWKGTIAKIALRSSRVGHRTQRRRRLWGTSDGARPRTPPTPEPPPRRTSRRSKTPERRLRPSNPSQSSCIRTSPLWPSDVASTGFACTLLPCFRRQRRRAHPQKRDGAERNTSKQPPGNQSTRPDRREARRCTTHLPNSPSTRTKGALEEPC